MIGDDDYSADDTICCHCYYFSASAVGVCVDDNATTHCCFCYSCRICHSQFVTVATAAVTYRYIGLQTAVKQTIYTGGDWKSQQIQERGY